MRLTTTAALAAYLIAASVPALAQEQASVPQAAAPEDPAPLPTIPVQVTEPQDAPEPDADKERTQLETVVVTSSKRAQALQKVPGTIGALTGKELEDIHAKSMEDYLKRVPGVSLPTSQFGPDATPPVIRGISVNNGFGNVNAPGSTTTGVFIDDIPFGTSLTSLQFPDMSPFDLERVEVMKGPQGTLFGAQALAGALRYITQKPALGLWQAKLQGSATRFGESDDSYAPYGAAAINIPLGNSFAIRGVGVYRESSGYIDVDTRSLTGGRVEKDVNSLRQNAQRVLARWQASDRLEVSGSWFRQVTTSADFGSTNYRDHFERNLTPFKVPGEQRFSLANLVVTYDFDWATLLSSTSRKTQSSGVDADLTGAFRPGIAGTPCDLTSPLGETGPCVVNPGAGPGTEDQTIAKVLNVGFTSDVTGYSQEIRLVSPDTLERWKWIAGASFQRDYQLATQIADVVALQIPLGIPLPPLPTPIGPLDLLNLAHFQQDSADTVGMEASLFGEVTRLLGRSLEVTVGGRLFRTSYEGVVVRRGAKDVIIGLDPNHPETTDTITPKSFNFGFNPRFSARLQINPNVMAYFLASKGFQFGGPQLTPPVPTGDPFPTEFKSSKLWNFELGTRTEWFHRRLSVDATLFYEVWTDLQIRVGTPDPTGLGLISFFYVDNVGAAKSIGGELSVRAIPFAGLVLSSALSRLNAVITEPFKDPESQETLPPGTRLPNTPKFQIANVISYAPRFDGWSPGLTLTHTYTGTSYNNLIADQKVGGYHSYDANLHVQKTNWRLRPDLSLAVTNVFDKRGIVNAEGNEARPAFNYVLTRPRTIELTLSLYFN